jgi:DDE superfamily endonuclease
MSTSNNQRLIRQLRCRDLDPRTKAEFCGLVVQAFVESTLKVSKWMTGRRGSPNWARGHFDMDSHLIALQPGYFKRLHRLSKVTFLELVTLIYPRLVRKKSRGPGKAGSMDPRVVLAITLRFLAGAICLDLAWPYCVAFPTAYSVIDETLEVLDDSLQNTKFPYTEDECRAASVGFQRPFYGVNGAIDGIAIAIRVLSPSECPNPRSFFNRNGFFAINVQAVVGADYSVLYLSAKHAGSTHDSTAFQSTALFNLLSLATGEIGALPAFAVLSADDAYGNGSCGCRIITPHSGRLTRMEDTFNFFWSSLRVMVEQVFGIIVARWGILWSPLRCSLKKCSTILAVCCILHNFIIQTRGQAEATSVPQQHVDNYVPGEAVMHMQDSYHNDGDTGRRVRRGAGARRDDISKSLYDAGYIRPARRRPS